MSLAAILGPIIARTAADVIAKKVGQKASPAVADDIAKAVLEQVKADPVMKNEMNEEPWYQSGVIAGLAGGVAGQAIVMTPLGDALEVLAPSVVWLINLFGVGLPSPEPGAVKTYIGALVTVGGIAYAGYRRLASGLKPLFSR